MSDLEITIRLPEALIERATSVGLSIEAYTDAFVDRLADEIGRREAGARLWAMAEAVHQLPDELKPTEAEIEEEIRAVREQRASG
jgi:predicted metal-dependent phosphoesterase TrpH